MKKTLNKEQILRQQAEKLFNKLEFLSPESIGQEKTNDLVHELRVHQIELEMQNDELRRSHVELDAIRLRYFDLYDLAPIGYCTNSKNGIIIEINLTATVMLGYTRKEMIRMPFSRYILKDDQDIYYHYKKSISDSYAKLHIDSMQIEKPQTCELRMIKKENLPFWVQLETTVAENDNEETIYRMVIIDITERKLSEISIAKNQKEYLLWKDGIMNESVIIRLLQDEVNELCGNLGQPIKYTEQKGSL